MGTSTGRQGHDQATWSNVPSSWQPGQKQEVEIPSTRPPSAAGEKQEPALIARASGPEAANFLVAIQSMRRKYPWSPKQSNWASRRELDMCLFKHQARHASRMMCCKAPGSLATLRSKVWEDKACSQTQLRTRDQPCDNNQASKACTGEPPRVDQAKDRFISKRPKTPTSWVAKSTSKCMPPPNSAARSQTEAARMRRLPTWTRLQSWLHRYKGGARAIHPYAIFEIANCRQARKYLSKDKRALWSELPPNRQRRARGSHSSSRSSPPRKHAKNTEGKGPTGTNDSMASGGQGAQTTPKVQTAQRKTNQHRKKKTKGQRPKQTKPNPKGKPTKARQQPQRVCKWARPINRVNRKVTRTMIQTSTSHGWTRDQKVSCTWTNQPCTASTSQTWFVTTQPYREDKNSAGLGMLQRRRGHSHAMWSNVPSSVQPSQMHMVEGRWSIRPPRAAGEKVAPQAKVLASAQEAANLRVACQSIRRK